MPSPIMRFTSGASLAAWLIAGCGLDPGPSPSFPPRVTTRPPAQKVEAAPKAKAAKPPQAAPAAGREERWSAPARRTGQADAPGGGTADAPNARPAAHPGRVGIMLPLSGPAASAGERVHQGVQLALRHSLVKYPDLRVQLAIRDTRSAAQSPGEAAEVAAELIGKENVIALIGPFLTQATEAAAEVANRLRAPMLTPFAIRMKMDRDSPWIFRNSLTNRLQGQGVAAYAVRRLGIERFAVLHPDNRDGKELADAFARAVESLGGRVVQIVAFPENANDFGAQMRALGGLDDRQLARRKLSLGLKKSDPLPLRLHFDALFVPAHHDKAVLIAPQALFYNMREIRLLGAGGWNHRRLIAHGERYVEGTVFVDGFFPDSEEPKVARFVHEFQAIFGRKPDILSALGYDAAQIIFSALAQGARTRAEVRQRLASLEGFDGVMGRTDMGADNDARRQLFVLSVRDNRIRHLQMVAPHRTPPPEEAEPTPRASGSPPPAPPNPGADQPPRHRRVPDAP